MICMMLAHYQDTREKVLEKKKIEVWSHTFQNLAKQYRHLSRRQPSIKKLSKKDCEQPMYQSQSTDLKFGYRVHQDRPS